MPDEVGARTKRRIRPPDALLKSRRSASDVHDAAGAVANLDEASGGGGRRVEHRALERKHLLAARMPERNRIVSYESREDGAPPADVEGTLLCDSQVLVARLGADRALESRCRGWHGIARVREGSVDGLAGLDDRAVREDEPHGLAGDVRCARSAIGVGNRRDREKACQIEKAAPGR